MLLGLWSVLGESMVLLTIVGQCMSLCITSKEMIPIVVVAAIFGKQWSQKVIQFHVDNMAVVQVINATFCSDDHLIHLVRLLVFFTSYYILWFYVYQIKGYANSLADAWQMHYHIITSIFSSHKSLQSPSSQQ